MTSEAHIETRQFTKDVVVRLATQVILNLRGIIFLPLIAQTMGKVQYGIWSQIMITLTLLTPIMTLRLEAAVVRYLSSKTGHDVARDFFPLLLVVWSLLLVLMGLGFAFRESLALALFGDTELVLFVSLFLIFLFFRTSMQFLLNYYRTFKRMTKYSAIELYAAFLEIGLALYIVLSGGTLANVLVPFVVVEALVVLWLLVDIVGQIGFPSELKFSRAFRYIKYSLPLIINRSLNWIVESSDRFLIVHLIVIGGLAQVGIYNASYQLGQLSLLFLWPITFVLFPTIAKLWEEKKPDDVKIHMQNALRYYLLLAIPSIFGLYYLAPELLAILATQEFVIEGHNLLILFILLGVLCMGITQIYVYVLHLKEMTHMMSLLFVGAAAINIGLNIWLIPEIGILAAAISTFVAYFVRMGFVMIYTSRLFWVGFDWIFMIKSLLAGGVMFLALSIFNPHGILAVLAIAVLGALIYLVLMILIGGIRKQELALVKSLVIRNA